MVLNTKSPRTGEEICNGLTLPAYTDHLRNKFGDPHAIGLSWPSLAAEIDANSLRVRIAELSVIISIAESHGDIETGQSCIKRKELLLAELGTMIKGGVPQGVPKPYAPPQVEPVEAEDALSTSGVYDVRIRWMEWTGKRPEMEGAIIQYTALKADDATCDAIHDGNAGEGPGAEFRQLRIRDYNTFCRKMKEYGYVVERLDAPSESPQQDNPFTVRPPV